MVQVMKFIIPIWELSIVNIAVVTFKLHFRYCKPLTKKWVFLGGKWIFPLHCKDEISMRVGGRIRMDKW